MTEQLYEQNARDVVSSNCNNNVSRLYSICDIYKMTKRSYKSHETIDKACMSVMLITISHLERLQ